MKTEEEMRRTELRRLSRKELIDIIYQLKKENESMKEELSDRRIAIQNAGSIAEAALAIHKVFETAQKAADQYLLSVKEGAADAKTQ